MIASFKFTSAVLFFITNSIFAYPNGSPICSVNDAEISANAMHKSSSALGYKFMVKYAGNNNWDISVQNTAGRKDFGGILLYVHQINQPQNHLGQIAFQDQAKWKYMTLETCTLQKIISSTPKSTVTHTKKDAVPLSSSSIFRWTATPEELSLNGLVVHGAIATTDQGVLKWQHLNYFGMAPIPRSGNVSASTITSVSSPDLAFSNDTIPSNTISTNVTISDLSNDSSTTAAASPTSTRTSYAGKDSMMSGVILASTLVLLFN